MCGAIRAVQTHLKKIAESITASEKRDLMMACVQYKDHCDRMLVSSEDFTPSVQILKRSIDSWCATGGGDAPEAVASGLDAASKLSWRQDSIKMLVLVSDAPPHGVGMPGDSYPNGSPLGLDPFVVARELTKREVIIYTVGVNNPNHYTVSFLCALSRMSGGRYLPLAKASDLPTILLGGAEEEVELAKFEQLMDDEEEKVVKEAKARGEELEEEEISMRVAANLARKDVKVSQLHVTTFGGGAAWKTQEKFISSATSSLSDYNSACSKVDYSAFSLPSGFGSSTVPTGSPGGSAFGSGSAFGGGGFGFTSAPPSTTSSPFGGFGTTPASGSTGFSFGDATPSPSPSSGGGFGFGSAAPSPSSGGGFGSGGGSTSGFDFGSAVSSVPVQEVEKREDFISAEQVQRHMSRKKR